MEDFTLEDAVTSLNPPFITGLSGPSFLISGLRSAVGLGVNSPPLPLPGLTLD